MFGYACDETDGADAAADHAGAQADAAAAAGARKKATLDCLRPDGKSQVTVEYEGDKPVRIDTVVVSTQHSAPGARSRRSARTSSRRSSSRCCRASCSTRRPSTSSTRPAASSSAARTATAASPAARSSSTPTAAWAATAAAPSRARTRRRSTARPATWRATSRRTSSPPGWPTRCEVQLAYAIGVAEPVSVMVDTEGTGQGRRGEARASWCARSSRSRRRASSSTSTCAGRSTQDGRLRPLRPQRAGVHLGEDRQGGRAQGVLQEVRPRDAPRGDRVERAPPRCGSRRSPPSLAARCCCGSSCGGRSPWWASLPTTASCAWRASSTSTRRCPTAGARPTRSCARRARAGLALPRDHRPQQPRREALRGLPRRRPGAGGRRAVDHGRPRARPRHRPRSRRSASPATARTPSTTCATSAACPSPRTRSRRAPDLRWSGFELPGPWGLELLNGDSDARRAGPRPAAEAAPLSPQRRLRAPRSQRPDGGALRRWDQLLGARRASASPAPTPTAGSR